MPFVVRVDLFSSLAGDIFEVLSPDVPSGIRVDLFSTLGGDIFEV